MTRLGGLLIIPVMLGAIAMVHFPHGWNSVNMGMGNMGRGMEFQVTLLLTALYFVLVGNRYSNPAAAARRTARRDHPENEPVQTH